MNKRAYLYIAALLGITSPFYAAPCISSSDLFKNCYATTEFCSGNVKDSNGEPIIGDQNRREQRWYCN